MSCEFVADVGAVADAEPEVAVAVVPVVAGPLAGVASLADVVVVHLLQSSRLSSKNSAYIGMKDVQEGPHFGDDVGTAHHADDAGRPNFVIISCTKRVSSATATSTLHHPQRRGYQTASQSVHAQHEAEGQ